MTQAELAERLGVSYQAVSRWENESSYPDIELLPAIAALFGVTVDYILGSIERHADRACWQKLNSLDDRAARLACLREMHRAYPEDQEVFFRLCEALWDPDECRRLTDEFLSVCTIPFMRAEAIRHVICVLDEDRVMAYMWEKNIPSEAWDPLLETRYLNREDARQYRNKRQFLLREHLREAFTRMEEGRDLCPASAHEDAGFHRPTEVDITGAETVLSVIAALTGIPLTDEHPATGDGIPDLWYSQRIWAALHIAQGLSTMRAPTGTARAIAYLEDAAGLHRRMRNLPPEAMMSYRTHGLDTLDLPRARCNLYYDRRLMEPFFADTAFRALREDPVLSHRFAACQAVFLEDAVD